ncbi:MAG: sporulation protein YqfD [Lachnospiraceae bacterium]|nr:sporulation protein YqfD [Lachnospiraceae bacterium]
MNIYFRMLRGYVRIKISGYGEKRFINICSKRGIELWEMERTEDDVYTNLTIADFRKIKEVVRKTNVKVVIVSKHGLPFFFARMSYRKCFILGAFLCISWLIYMSNFVWAIDIEGNKSITDDMILDYLSQNEIEIGSRRKNIDAETLEKMFRRDFDGITWISIGQEGTVLSIDIKERDVAMYEEEASSASSLYAPYNGEIVSIVVRSGLAKVKAGDIVEEGQLLVDGILPVVKTDGTITGYQLVNADADVIIRFKDNYYDEISYYSEEKVYTGESSREFYVRLNNKMYGFHWFLPDFEKAETIQSFYQVKLWEHFYLPVWFGVSEHKEYVLNRVKNHRSDLETDLYEKLELFLANLEEKGVQNMQKDVKISTSGSRLILSGELTNTGSEMLRKEINASMGTELTNGQYNTVNDGNEH